MVTDKRDRNAAVALYRSINPHWHPDQKRYEPAIDKIEAEFAAVRAERDTELVTAAQNLIRAIAVACIHTPQSIWQQILYLEEITAAQYALNALIVEVKP